MADFVLGRIRFQFKGEWTAATSYIKDDCVEYGGNVYVVKENHTSNADFYVDLAATKVAKFTSGQAWKGAWAATTYYKVDEVVSWGGKNYICNTGHTSQASLYDDTAKWTEYNSGFAWKGAYTNATAYKLNDVIKYGASTYICNTQHTAGATLDEAKFDLFASGLEFEDSWLVGTQYQLGDVVTYGGYNYVAARQNVGVSPYNNTSDWEVLTTGFKLKSTYNNATAYNPGDVVIFGGHSFSAKVDTTGNTPDSSTHWEKIVEGFTWKDSWADTTVYNPGDTVSHLANAYRCKLTHTSNNGVNDPVTDSSGTYWDVLTEGDSQAVLTQRGDVLSRNSTANYRLPIGAAGAYLRSDGSDPSWETGPIGVADGGTGVGTVAADTILTGNTTGALTSEANLTFDGSTLSVTGDVNITGLLQTVDYDVSGDTVLATAKVSDLTDGRVVIAGSAGEIEDDAGFTYNKTLDLLTASNITASTAAILASASVTDLDHFGVVIAGSSGELDTDANFTFNGTHLELTNIQVDITGDLDIDNINLNGNTITTTDINGDLTFTPNGTGGIVFSTAATQATAPTIGSHVSNKVYVDEEATSTTTALFANPLTGALMQIRSTNFNVPTQWVSLPDDDMFDTQWFHGSTTTDALVSPDGHLQLIVL
jgi:chitodextrinase